MSRFHFRPFVGLTVFTVVSLAILIALGTWQYQRLQWKTALLAEVEQAVNAPPLESLSQASRAYAQGVPVDFRRIETEVEILAGQTPFLVYSRSKSELMWRPYYAVKDSSSGTRSFVALTPISNKVRGDIIRAKGETRRVAGYVRIWRAAERGAVKSTPEANRWFGFDPLRESAPWSNGVDNIFKSAPIETQFYIDVANDVEGEVAAAALPIKRPEIRNNHFDYMLTWYGLALVLFIIYIILHVQRGRVGLKPKHVAGT